jgi:integrase
MESVTVSDDYASSEEDIEVTGEISELFDLFAKWLQSTDGGRKEGKIAKQHASQVKKMLTVEDEKEDISSLFDITHIRDIFLKSHADRKYRPATIKSYLMSLRHFCGFVRSEKPIAVKVKEEMISRMSEKARIWATTYKKDSNKRFWQKQKEDESNLLTPEKVKQFERSKVAREAVKLIGEFSDGKRNAISQSEFTTVRNYLIAEIIINNAPRSGVIANMTIKEFKQAIFEDDQHSVSVVDHKTGDCYGPADVFFHVTLYNYVRIYIDNIRNMLNNATLNDNARVFINWGGESMAENSGQVTAAFKAIWNKAGFAGPVSSTLMRKTAATIFNDNHQESTEDLADLMGHRIETQRKYYRLKQKRKTASRAAKKLTSVMRMQKSDKPAKQKEESKCLSSKEKEDDNQCELPSEHETAEQRVARVFPENPVDPVEDHDSQEDTSSIVPPTTITTQNKGLFSEDDVKLLKALCGGMFIAGPIAKPIVKKNLESNKEGADLLKKFSMFQIINRLKYERKLSKRK